jgi:hypothetical protein
LFRANFDNQDKFLTLTFAENITDVKVANKEFKKGIKRLRYLYPDLKYLAVIEFQERGAVHYHMLAKLPFIKNSKLAEIWGNGFVKIRQISHVDDVGRYVTKYMNKDLSDIRLQGLKAYNCSKNLTRWRELKSWNVAEMKEIYQVQDDLENETPAYEKAYTSEYGGQVNVLEFNFNQNELYRHSTKDLAKCQDSETNFITCKSS